MKLTENDFWSMSENWYQRTHRLREVWQNELETPERKEKAYKLWEIMLARVMKLAPTATKLRNAKFKINPNLRPGGLTIKIDNDSAHVSNEERIIPSWVTKYPNEKRNN